MNRDAQLRTTTPINSAYQRALGSDIPLSKDMPKTLLAAGVNVLNSAVPIELSAGR
jgi:hypothetical protein